jgi:hypothetical protein
VVDLGFKVLQGCRELFRQISVDLGFQQIVDGFGVGQARGQRIEAIEFLAQTSEFGRYALRPGLVFPERWIGRLGFVLFGARSFRVNVKGTPSRTKGAGKGFEFVRCSRSRRRV